MNLVVTLEGPFDEYFFMILVNNCFVRTVLTNRHGSRDGVVTKFLFVVWR